MEVGDYVRTNLRNEIVIRKVIGIIHSTTMNDNRMVFDKPTKFTYYVEDNKNYESSPNIIDLIEVGDYVNGYKVSFVDEEPVIGKFVQCDYEVSFGTTNHYRFYEADIKSIVTKEQFSQMEYKIGE